MHMYMYVHVYIYTGIFTDMCMHAHMNKIHTDTYVQLYIHPSTVH